jgi:quercetin dioxygenase-like cupin family protein
MLDAAIRTIEAIAPDTGDVLDVFGATMTVKLDGATGLFLARHQAPPGYAVPLHVHDEDDEIFWVLGGTLTMLSTGGAFGAGQGSCVHLPHGIPHGFRNDTASAADVLLMVTPGRRIAAMFRALDHLTKTGTPTPESIGAVCAWHGVRLL